MTNEKESFRILREDILRILGESDEAISLLEIEGKLNEPPSFDRAVEQLADQGFLTISKNVASLTDKGKEVANEIYEKHCIIEDYWTKSAIKNKDEAHRVAHLLEHQVSKKVIDNIRVISEINREGIPLSEFSGIEGMITNISVEGSLFERLISMGFSPGEELEIVERLTNSIIITIKNKKLAVDREIAKKVRVLEGAVAKE